MGPRPTGPRSRRQGWCVRRLLPASLCILGSATAAAGQARPPLAIAVDSTGVLSAIRATDLRQLCRCPVVRLDTIIRQSSRLSMFDILDGRPLRALTASETGQLRLARHRIERTALRTMLDVSPDKALMAVQVVPTPAPRRRVLVSVTPPSKATRAFLVSLVPDRDRWRVEGIQTVYEP